MQKSDDAHFPTCKTNQNSSVGLKLESDKITRLHNAKGISVVGYKQSQEDNIIVKLYRLNNFECYHSIDLNIVFLSLVNIVGRSQLYYYYPQYKTFLAIFIKRFYHLSDHIIWFQ
jgi:hypothetical protein